MPSIPTILLSSGKHMPIHGLGTWGSPPGQVAQAVKDAIAAGYRQIDGAHVYQNEHEVGEGVNAKIADGTIKREDIFIVSKLWNTDHAVSRVRPGIENTLKNLNLAYLDLYLIHWPMAYKEGDVLFPKDDKEAIIFSDADFVETWKEMEKLVDAGLTKSIGVSNFNKRQLERVLANARIPPAVNQVECHPYLPQKKLSAFCKEHNIAITAYSPLGSPTRPWAKAGDPVLLDEPKLAAIAAKHNKDIAQILIRYQIERNHVVIPKSVTKSRIISNFNVFDFTLTKEEIAEIEAFERPDGRLCIMSGHEHHPNNPFADEY